MELKLQIELLVNLLISLQSGTIHLATPDIPLGFSIENLL
jgi:hypothetical protein